MSAVTTTTKLERCGGKGEGGGEGEDGGGGGGSSIQGAADAVRVHTYLCPESGTRKSKEGAPALFV